MTIKDILAHVDDSPAAQARFDIALGLAAPFGARVTALHLIAEPFMRGVSTHIPGDVVQEHVAHAEVAADAEALLLANDTDPDTGDSKAIQSVSATSAAGASERSAVDSSDSSSL